MKRNIVLEREYAYPIEMLWEALTDSEAMGDWLMPNNFQPYVGHRFTFRTSASIGFDGTVYCEVITVNRPNYLAYTWQGGMMKVPTTVTWHLREIAIGTHLTLEHTGFEGLAGVAISHLLGMGWRKMLETRLRKILDKRERYHD